MEKKRNLWVIPTDKPSKLWINNLLQGKLELNEEALPFNTAQHLYITSDEEIKEGIYTIDLRFNTIVKITTLNIEDCKIGFYDGSLKKIILTTDQDLIADGIQTIDDEFLEWFVNNPSCEYLSTPIVKLCENCGQQFCDNRDCRGYIDKPYYLLAYPETITEKTTTYCNGYEINSKEIMQPKKETELDAYYRNGIGGAKQ